MVKTDLPAPPRNWWERNKGRIAAGALIWVGLAVVVGVVQDQKETTTPSTPYETTAIDHQVGYVSPETVDLVEQVAAEDSAQIQQACEELRTLTYDEALAAFMGGEPPTSLDVEWLDGTILYCRNH